MVDRTGRPLFAAAVQVRKNDDSFHFMPIYMNPDLRGSLSPELRKRMQGKGCFSFSTIGPADARELAVPTREGLAGCKNLKLPWARSV